MNSFAVGVDIGGSHITAALIDLDNKTLLEGSRCRATVDALGSAEAIIDAWSRVIKNCSSGHEEHIAAIGIAMPGPFDYQHGICQIRQQQKYGSLYGQNVRSLLSHSLAVDGQRILFENDAACFLNGEMFCGVGRDYSTAVGLTLGTGLGSAVSQQGKVMDADLWCAPFRDGIAEDYFSNRGLIKAYQLATGVQVDSARELAQLAEQDEAAYNCFLDFGAGLAEFIAPCIREKEAEVLVLGGNIARAFPLFSTALTKGLADTDVTIRQTVLGEDASLVGAASLWKAVPEASKSW